MQLRNLTIGTRQFYLPADTDFAQLQNHIENAARIGGAMIDIPHPNGHMVSALITPATPVFTETIDLPEDSADHDAHSVSPFDVDLTGSFPAWDT